MYTYIYILRSSKERKAIVRTSMQSKIAFVPSSFFFFFFKTYSRAFTFHITFMRHTRLLPHEIIITPPLVLVGGGWGLGVGVVCR